MTKSYSPTAFRLCQISSSVWTASGSRFSLSVPENMMASWGSTTTRWRKVRRGTLVPSWSSIKTRPLQMVVAPTHDKSSVDFPLPLLPHIASCETRRLLFCFQINYFVSSSVLKEKVLKKPPGRIIGSKALYTLWSGDRRTCQVYGSEKSCTGEKWVLPEVEYLFRFPRW